LTTARLFDIVYISNERVVFYIGGRDESKSEMLKRSI
jgi:hypothetical protein